MAVGLGVGEEARARLGSGEACSSRVPDVAVMRGRMVGVCARLAVDLGAELGRLMHPALSKIEDNKIQAVMRIHMIAGLCSMRVGLAIVNPVAL